jgi:ComF family protein
MPWSGYGRFWRQNKVNRLFDGLANLIWPPLCPISGQPVSAVGLIAGAGWATIQFIDSPQCDRCGVPFEYLSFEPMESPACIARPPVYAKARSAFVYNDHSRNLVLSFKHGGRSEIVRSFGQWMARAGAVFLADADVLIPVPLHASRLRKRRFNQSVLLARSVSKCSGVPVDGNSLQRHRATPSQAGQSAKSRQRNVAGAFKIRNGCQDEIVGKRVVVIDDVFTTGATLEACARVLNRAGAKDVSVITLSRVVKPVDPTK